jgi:hypothetical protein
MLRGKRVSRDIDLFHDTEEALGATWEADRRLLETDGLEVDVMRERRGFVEARISGRNESVLVQWARDSAFRFFPLIEHDEFGLTLHPFDLATNKVLALVGRLEVRDWIDLIQCHESLQPLGYLIWASCGKDPGFGPLGILEEASRSSHYSKEEVNALVFEGPAPDAAGLSRRWHGAMACARQIIETLPFEKAGQAVLGESGDLFRGTSEVLRQALGSGGIRFHPGTIRGVLPRMLQ